MDFYAINNYFKDGRKPFSLIKYDPKVASKIRKGKSLANEDNFEIRINYNDEKLLVDFYDPGVPIVSERLKNLLEQQFEKELFEFCGINVFKSADPANQKYYAFNILENMDCFDKENSVYNTFEGSTVINSIAKLVLKEEMLSRRNIFRITPIRTAIFVNQKFKQAIEENNITGLSFISLGEFKII